MRGSGPFWVVTLWRDPFDVTLPKVAQFVQKVCHSINSHRYFVPVLIVDSRTLEHTASWVPDCSVSVNPYGLRGPYLIQVKTFKYAAALLIYIRPLH
jgi:hypothetical protein